MHWHTVKVDRVGKDSAHIRVLLVSDIMEVYFLVLFELWGFPWPLVNSIDSTYLNFYIYVFQKELEMHLGSMVFLPALILLIPRGENMLDIWLKPKLVLLTFRELKHSPKHARGIIHKIFLSLMDHLEVYACLPI